jgi:hypothetical protein
MMFLILVVVCVLFICLATIFPDRTRECVLAVCTVLESLLRRLLDGSCAVLFPIAGWISKDGRPSASNSLWALIGSCVLYFSIKGMYTQVRDAFEFIFDEPPLPLVFSVTVLASFVGALIHLIDGRLKKVVIVLAVFLICFLGLLGYYQAETTASLDLEKGYGLSMSESEMDTTVKEPYLAAILMVLLGLLEMITAYGIVHFLHPGGAGYVLFLVLLPFVIVFGITWLLARSGVVGAAQRFLLALIGLCEGMPHLIVRWTDYRHALRELRISTAPLRKQEREVRHIERLARTIDQLEERVTRNYCFYFAKKTQRALHILQKHVLNAANQIGGQTAERVVRRIFDYFEDFLSKHLDNSGKGWKL